MVELPAPAASLLFWHTTDVSVLRQVLAPRIRASEEFRPSFRPARRGGRKRSQEAFLFMPLFHIPARGCGKPKEECPRFLFQPHDLQGSGPSLGLSSLI